MARLFQATMRTMKDRPFTKLLIALGIFVVVAFVFSHFRHGIYLTDLAGLLLCTLFSAAGLDHLIWPRRSDRSAFRRAGLLLDLIIIGLIATWILFAAFKTPKPIWLMVVFLVFCAGKLIYLWIEHRREARRAGTMDPLQSRLIQKHRDKGG
jgi:Ca2+/Na+ antiporter